ncbi:MAG TPA: LTA synthase family protein [Verrucomicrobiae bacterium]|jgi:phosphoglycerol transferase MdoB-like AlkP superfamily enzyme|nr:LTA synthase family protein [Verrucomicrobiae bacterium]
MDDKTNPQAWTCKRFLLVAGLAIFWALENCVVQATAFPGAPSTLHPWTFSLIRFCLDASFAGFVVFAFNRAGLLVAATLSFLISLAVLPYGIYFHHALSLGAMHAAGEGLSVADLALKFVPWWMWLSLLAALGLKVFWVFKITPQPRAHRFQLAGACVMASVAIVVTLQVSSFHFGRLRVERASRAVFVYGYLNTWIAEYFLAPPMKQVIAQAQALQNDSPDRLTIQDPVWPAVQNVAIVQLESVGWQALHCRINGKEVMPYFSHLADSSRLYKVKSFHDLGSADMDYAVLSDGTPSSSILSYEIPGLTYTNDLPRFMQHQGFHTVAFHGNGGSFFNRRENYARMGFDEILFREDLREASLPLSRWGLRDADLFAASSRKMSSGSGAHQFHFLITIDSHAPFDVVTDSEKEIFPHSTDWRENYFNSLISLDHTIEKYVTSLPAGTLVVFYGDHTPGVEYGDFRSEREGNAEYVPCVMHYCGASKDWVTAGSEKNVPADLRILDVMNAMRHEMTRDSLPHLADISSR